MRTKFTVPQVKAGTVLHVFLWAMCMKMSPDIKSAFTIVNGYTDDEDIVISLPEGYQVETMPAGKELNTRFATFKVAYQKEEKSLHVLYHLVMHAGTYTHDDFAEFVKVKNSIATAYRQQIVLVKP